MINEKYVYAGFWIRFLANLIDSIFITFIVTIWLFLDHILNLVIVSLNDSDIYFNTYFDVTSQIIAAIICIIFWVFLGSTPGKLLLKIRILDQKTGKNITFIQGILRYLAYFISMIFLFVGYIWRAFDKKKQGWHDKIAKTVVIKEFK